MVDSYIKLPSPSLYGQSPLGSSSSLRLSSTQGVAGMSDYELSPKRFNILPVFPIPSRVCKRNQL